VSLLKLLPVIVRHTGDINMVADIHKVLVRVHDRECAAYNLYPVILQFLNPFLRSVGQHGRAVPAVKKTDTTRGKMFTYCGKGSLEVGIGCLVTEDMEQSQYRVEPPRNP